MVPNGQLSSITAHPPPLHLQKTCVIETHLGAATEHGGATSKQSCATSLAAAHGSLRAKPHVPYQRITQQMDIVNLFSLKGRTALVTGSSRGIGRMIAHAYLVIARAVAGRRPGARSRARRGRWPPTRVTAWAATALLPPSRSSSSNFLLAWPRHPVAKRRGTERTT